MNHVSRDAWIDYAKAIGIVLVVYGHVVRGIQSTSPPEISPIFGYIDEIIYSFHMPLFFFIAGIFFFKSFEKYGYKGILKNKLCVIIYPYILWSLIQGGIELISSQYTNHSITAEEILALWEPRAQFWFLYALFFCFFFAASIRLILTNHKQIFLIMLLAASLFIYRDLPLFNTTMKLISKSYIYFEFGVFYTLMKNNHHFNKYLLLMTATILIVSQTLESRVLPLLYAVIGIAIVIMLAKTIERKYQSETLRIIGMASISIYLMHIIFGSGVRVILTHYLHIENISIHIMTGMLFGIALPTLVYMVITRYKINWIYSAPCK
jgi:fucose 4-O-acetylase-like acetyltransferase